MVHWRRYGDYWQAWVGNGLYLRCQKVQVFECYPLKRGGKYVTKWNAKVIAGAVDVVEIRSSNHAGTDGHCNYRTLKEAQAAAVNDAEAVGKAILGIIEEMRTNV